MKSFSLLCLASTSAQAVYFNKISQNYDKFKDFHGLGPLHNPSSPTVESSFTRAISGSDMELLQNYGCWCNFDSNKRGNARGQPVDFFDQACKTLKEGYECIEIDGQNASDECDIATTTYRSALGDGINGMTMEALVEECDRNDTPCQKRLCVVDGWFMQSIIRMAFGEGNFPDVANFKHENGVFDFEATCQADVDKKTKTGSGNGTRELSCCGSYPNRFPFATGAGNRECCVDKTYNTNIFMCCDDGQVRLGC